MGGLTVSELAHLEQLVTLPNLGDQKLSALMDEIKVLHHGEETPGKLCIPLPSITHFMSLFLT